MVFRDRYNLSYYYQLFDVYGNLIRESYFSNLDYDDFNNGTTLVTGHLSNLSYYTNYSIRIRGYNQQYLTEGNYSTNLPFKTGPYYPPLTHTPIVEYPYIYLNETSNINGPIELYILQIFCSTHNTSTFLFDMNYRNNEYAIYNNIYWIDGFVSKFDIRNYTTGGDICNSRLTSFTTPNFQSISNYSELIRIPTQSPSPNPN